MGIELVLPNGDVVVTGGKSMKDVAGYNLKDVLVGSEGSLGVFQVASEILRQLDNCRIGLH